MWQELFEHFADDVDMEKLMIDSSVTALMLVLPERSEKKGARSASPRLQ